MSWWKANERVCLNNRKESILMKYRKIIATNPFVLIPLYLILVSAPKPLVMAADPEPSNNVPTVIQRVESGWNFEREMAAKYAKARYPQYFLEVPITKCIQFNMLTMDQEMEFGNRWWATIETNPIPADLARAQRRVARLGSRIEILVKSITNAPPVTLKFRVVSDDSFNATCMVGGRITVNSGVLDVTRNDDELAFIISHEVGHAVARHAGETMTREIMRKGGLDAAAFIADWAESQRHIQKGTVTNILVGLDVATVLTTAYPHKREQESEADYLGLMLMAGAGFRPEAAVDLWRRVASSRSDPGSSIARAVAKYCGTHPPDSARIAQLQAALPDARRFLQTER